MPTVTSAVADAAESLGNIAASQNFYNVLVSNTPKLTLKPDLIYRLHQEPIEEYTREPDADFLADMDLGYIDPS